MGGDGNRGGGRHHGRNRPRRPAQNQGGLRSAAPLRQGGKPQRRGNQCQGGRREYSFPPQSDKAFKDADVVSEGQYGIPVVTHCCLEPHGSVVQWQGDQVHVFPSTQYISGTGSATGAEHQGPHRQYSCDTHVFFRRRLWQQVLAGSWGEVGAFLSQKAGGRPERSFLDRGRTVDRGQPPLGLRQDQVAGKKDGTVTAWQSDAWGTGGFTGGGSPPLPYIIDTIPNSG